MKLLRCHHLSIALFIIGISTPSNAADDFMQMARRPSLPSFWRSKTKSKANPINYDERVVALSLQAPQLIAELEFMYPGATFVCIGRDTSFIADILETEFWVSSMEDRLVRLDISATTIENLNDQQRNDVFFKLLESHQLIGKNAKYRKLVFIDSASWFATSQMRAILRVARQHSGLSAEEQSLRMNAVAVKSPGGNIGNENHLAIVNSIVDIPLAPDGVPEKVYRVNPDFAYLNPSPGSAEISWHDKFGPIEMTELGWRASLPKTDSLTIVYRRQQRAHILWTIEQIKLAVSHSSFSKSMESHAQAGLGYDIWKTRKLAAKEYLVDLDDLRSEKLQTLVHDYSSPSIPDHYAKKVLLKLFTRAVLGLHNQTFTETDFLKLVLFACDNSRALALLQNLATEKKSLEPILKKWAQDQIKEAHKILPKLDLVTAKNLLGLLNFWLGENFSQQWLKSLASNPNEANSAMAIETRQIVNEAAALEEDISAYSPCDVIMLKRSK